MRSGRGSKPVPLPAHQRREIVQLYEAVADELGTDARDRRVQFAALMRARFSWFRATDITQAYQCVAHMERRVVAEGLRNHYSVPIVALFGGSAHGRVDVRAFDDERAENSPKLCDACVPDDGIIDIDDFFLRAARMANVRAHLDFALCAKQQRLHRDARKRLSVLFRPSYSGGRPALCHLNPIVHCGLPGDP